MEIVQRPTFEAFAAAFTEDVVLDASVLSGSLRGAADIRTFLDATREMYDLIAFSNEANAGRCTFLQWEGLFEDRDVAGLTVLTKNAAGLIESIRLYHRPFSLVTAFSVELMRRVARKLTLFGEGN